MGPYYQEQQLSDREELTGQIAAELRDRLRRSLFAQAFIAVALGLMLREAGGAALWAWVAAIVCTCLFRYGSLRWGAAALPAAQIRRIRLGVTACAVLWSGGVLWLGSGGEPIHLAILWIVASGITAGAGHALHPDRTSHYLFAVPVWLATTATLLLGLPTRHAIPVLALSGLFAIHQWRSVEDRHGRIRGLLAANRHLERARREAEAGLETQRNFLANMSHEIRTPLNGILGMTDLLLRSRLDGDQIEQVGTIKTCGTALLQIINEILDYSKIRSEMLELEDADFDLLEITDQTLDMLSQPARQKGLVLAAVVDPAVPRWVRGDATRLRQVLVNLGSNAVKFTETGHVNIRVGLEDPPGTPKRLRFEIIDTGPGISEAERERLFQPFVQADASTTRRHGGTGLGLSISMSLVEQMGGTIGCKSEAGSGSCFYFFLPLRLAAAPPEPETPADWADSARVLVAHEREPVRSMIGSVLERAGIAVEYARDPELLAAQMIQRDPALDRYSAVLLSSSAGQQQLRRLAEDSEGDGRRRQRVPVVVVSSSGLRGDSRRWQKAGLSGALTLPARRELLLAHVEAAVTGTPLRLSRDRREIPDAALDATPPWGGDSSDVLVIEDNPINLRVVERMLRELGRTARLCETGEEGIRAWEHVRPSLVLCDVQMPDMDGLEVARRIRQLEGAGPRTPIVALTAGTGGDERDRCLAAGMDDYLTKPIGLDTLAAVLERRSGKALAGAALADRPGSEG